MRLTQRYLIVGLVSTMVPFTIVATAPTAGADCNYAGGSTICAQGEVRGADGVPRAATPSVPYPCENDWYCGTDWDLDVDWDPGPTVHGFPAVAAVASDHVGERTHDPSTT